MSGTGQKGTNGLPHRGAGQPVAAIPVMAALLVFLLLLVAMPLPAGTIWLPDLGSGSNVPTSSLRERKFETIIRQQFDFSCGSAALATLLSYHYDDPTTEQTAFTAMYERGDTDKIQRQGFSLLDIKMFLEDRGYEADGYKTTLENLEAAGVPAIALVNVQGYRHFVVVKGLTGPDVLVGDPALGLRMVQRDKFEEMWENKILFIIRNRSDVAREYFNADNEWKLIARAPLGEAISRESLGALTISLPQLNDISM